MFVDEEEKPIIYASKRVGSKFIFRLVLFIIGFVISIPLMCITDGIWRFMGFAMFILVAISCLISQHKGEK